jgi:hypothetical protein
MLAKDLRLALDPVVFAMECLDFTPDPWQAEVLRAIDERMILNCARQVGKSTVAAIMALHRLLFFPSSLILLVSPSQQQSSELFRKTMDFLKLLPIKPKMVEENKLSMQVKNGSRIVSLPGDEGNIRGYSRVSLIIEDEASRVSDDLYRAVRPMLAVSSGRLVLMSTPFGKRGHFYEEWQNGSNWYKVSIPATECQRITPQFLEQERNSLGEWWFEQEYMCKFVEAEDQFFRHNEIMEALDYEIEPISLS